MVQLTPDGKYRGPFGPNPRKTKADREKELLGLADQEEGLDIILCLWKEAKGIPAGSSPPGTIGTFVRQEMIPDILAHEYPHG